MVERANNSTPFSDVVTAKPRSSNKTTSKLSKILVLTLFAIAAIPAASFLREAQQISHVEKMSDETFKAKASTLLDRPRSQKHLVAIARRAASLNPPNIQMARNALDQAAIYPRPCLNCETQRVYIDTLENRSLSAAGLQALKRSYDISLYGSAELMKWRLELSNGYWNDLDEDLQKKALMQITALALSEKKDQQWLAKFESNIPDIQARIARIRVN